MERWHMSREVSKQCCNAAETLVKFLHDRKIINFETSQDFTGRRLNAQLIEA